MPLEYNVKREYTIPHLNTYFALSSIVSIGALTVLNVILQGYDVVTILSSNPNATIPYWWSTSAFSVRSAGECSPVSLSQGSTISTNHSLFSYDIRSTFDKSGQSMTGASSYLANDLHNCTVDSMMLTIDEVRRTLQFDIPVLCIGRHLPFSLSLESKFTLSYDNTYLDDTVSHYTQNMPSQKRFESQSIERNTSSLVNVIAVLDAVGADLQVAYWETELLRNSGLPSVVSVTGISMCPGGQNSTCDPGDRTMAISECAAGYVNGTHNYTADICDFLAPIESEIVNTFTVFRDAYQWVLVD
ncbi:hypothetical protein RhiJN_02246 [Ceratobasidium sp. AG-Ba]|nr:hypothetical protein RhiJN_02246 [Ceratobasidium sp. AG-Ba]QRW03182.1 hypothetical protein RhiLY_02181 [Ceratobasidium sp. AG-Ba]